MKRRQNRHNGEKRIIIIIIIIITIIIITRIYKDSVSPLLRKHTERGVHCTVVDMHD